MNSDFASRHPRLAELFGIDLRTLALFRVALGAVLFCSVWMALGDTRAFWTDLGVLPRGGLVESDSQWRLSLHLISGETWFIGALLCVQLGLALMLLLGWRARLASVLSFVLWASLLNRNPMVLSGADTLIACLLFWSMFLPLGARFSVDAARSTTPPPPHNPYLSWATLGLLLQVMCVYFFGALLKQAPEWTGDYTAMYYALSLDRQVLPLGRLLNEYLPLTQALTAYIRWLELLGPLLIFTPFFLRPVRLAVVLAFALMQGALWLCLELGALPFVSLAALSAFMGGWVWDRLGQRQQQRHPGALHIYYDRDCGFCLKMCRLLQQFLILPQAHIAAAQDTARARTLMEANHSWVVIDADESAHLKWSAFAILLKRSPLLGWLWPLARRPAVTQAGDRLYDGVARHRGGLGTFADCVMPQRQMQWELAKPWHWLAALAVVLVLIWNLTTIHWLPTAVQQGLAPLMRVLRIDQTWDLFAPHPLKEDGWLVIPGRLADGREIDLLHPQAGAAPSYERPALYSQDHDNLRWLSYRGRLWEPAARRDRAHYGRYLCQRWNQALADEPESARPRLMTLKMIYMLERTPAPGQQAPVEQVVIWRDECFPEETRGQIP